MIGKLKKLRALEIIARHQRPCGPVEFARMMWPESSGWRARSKTGPAGARMISAGAGFLGRLAADHLLQRVGTGYTLTDAGVAFQASRGDTRSEEPGEVEPVHPRTNTAEHQGAPGRCSPPAGLSAPTAPPPWQGPPCYVGMPWNATWFDGRYELTWDGRLLWWWRGDLWIPCGA